MIIFNTDKFKGKELIVNSYEHQVENFENDIKNTSEKYFSLPKNGIISRAFYKLWEILMTFDLLPHKGSINCVHLAEAPGGFIQATALYRKKFYTDSDIKKDTFTSISKKTCGKTKKKNEFILYKDDKFKNLANIQIYEEEDCDLMKNKIQKNLFKSTGEADFITADGGFEWQNENYQEQESYPLVLAEIICALRIQKKGGNFVIKIFETFTDITVKLIMILSTYYENVIIYKPFTSRPSNSERYLICFNFKGIDIKELNNLEKLLDDINEQMFNNKFLADIFPKYNISNNVLLTIKASSSDIVNTQFISINNQIKYVEAGNFFDDVYQTYYQNQKDANMYWTSLFFPTGEIKLARKNINELFENSIKRSIFNTNELKKKLI